MNKSNNLILDNSLRYAVGQAKPFPTLKNDIQATIIQYSSG